MEENNIISRISNVAYNININDIGMPTSMKLELSSICNHKCSYCIVPSLKIKEKYMSEKIFYKALEEAKKNHFKEIGLFHMGEGTLHPQFCKFVEQIPNTFDIFITTNGTQLDKLKYLVERNIRSIKISLNGYNREIHKKNTGVDTFDLVINNLKEIIKYRNEISSTTQISASSIFYNCKEQNEFVDKIEKIVDSYYYTQIYNQANKVDNKFIKLTDDKHIMKNTMNLPCFGLYNLCHIKVNGDVNLCRFGVDNEFTIGNIMNSSLDDIWFSKKAQTLRDKSTKGCLETCNKCVGISNGL